MEEREVGIDHVGQMKLWDRMKGLSTEMTWFILLSWTRDTFYPLVQWLCVSSKKRCSLWSIVSSVCLDLQCVLWWMHEGFGLEPWRCVIEHNVTHELSKVRIQMLCLSCWVEQCWWFHSISVENNLCSLLVLFSRIAKTVGIWLLPSCIFLGCFFLGCLCGSGRLCWAFIFLPTCRTSTRRLRAACCLCWTQKMKSLPPEGPSVQVQKKTGSPRMKPQRWAQWCSLVDSQLKSNWPWPSV